MTPCVGIALPAQSAEAGSSKQSQGLDPQEITDAVENEIAFHPSVSLNDIDVATSADQRVTLKGSVTSLVEKNRAERLAETVRGVRDVDNEITVEPYWDLTDGDIRNMAENALLRNHVTESYEITVNVSEGIATLTGTVDSWVEKTFAGDVVAGVRGVVLVVNDLAVVPAEDRLPGEIAEEVRARLAWDALVADGMIVVTVADDTVKLTGTVKSAAERTRAMADAWVTGVDRVDASGLKVDDTPSGDTSKDHSIVSDAAAETAIELDMLYDARVNSMNVDVEVDNGVATLRGEVPALIAKRAAAESARDTLGVVVVDNRIKVRPSTPDDEEIEDRIEQAIFRDPYLERYEIDAEVIDGTAYLNGTVDTYFEKSLADSVAATIYGVKEVSNQLIVEDESVLVYDPFLYDPYFYEWTWYDYEPGVTYVSDAVILDEIRDELWWSPFVDSEQVNVTVSDGVATLTGTVDSWSELRAAAENAFEGGATWVKNELEVSSGDEG